MAGDDGVSEGVQSGSVQSLGKPIIHSTNCGWILRPIREGNMCPRAPQRPFPYVPAISVRVNLRIGLCICDASGEGKWMNPASTIAASMARPGPFRVVCDLQGTSRFESVAVGVGAHNKDAVSDVRGTDSRSRYTEYPDVVVDVRQIVEYSGKFRHG